MTYEKQKVRNSLALLLMIVCLGLMALIALRAGSYDITISELLLAFFGKASSDSATLVIRNMRLPRVLTAIAGGMGLGVSGCVLQAVLRNPLASASTIGISQGASFGACFAIIILGASTSKTAVLNTFLSGRALVTGCAFLFSLAVAIAVLLLSRFRSIDPQSMILTGIAFSLMFQGGTTLLQFFASETELSTFVFWTFGDLSLTDYKDISVMFIIVALSLLFFWLNRWNYNALETGENNAISVGVSVASLQVVSMLICSLVTAVIIANLGTISFIGLAAPHIARGLTGSNHSFTLPGSALAGALLLLLGDLISRTIISPVVLPIGAITAFLGGPLFVYLILKGGKQRATSR